MAVPYGGTISHNHRAAAVDGIPCNQFHMILQGNFLINRTYKSTIGGLDVHTFCPCWRVGLGGLALPQNIQREWKSALWLCTGLLIAAAAALAAIFSIGSGRAAIVGETRTVEIKKASDPTVDQLKAAYTRPATIPFPKSNPYTAEKADLGKKLYFDPRLSAAKAQSCASCHSPGFGWGDGLAKGVGHNMKMLGRRSPTIVNAAFSQIYMWDGRAATLEEQALGPIQAEVEMNLPLSDLLARLKDIPEYVALFRAAFPKDGITEENIAKAIATYERTVVSGISPFDAWVDGNDTAISDAAKRGFAVFNTKAGCAACHSGWNFTDDSFHDIGLNTEDIGRAKIVPGVLKMEKAFKTPGLREIARRGPYMHNGSLKTLEEVVDHYDSGGVERPSRSDAIKPLGLTQQEKSDLVAFMLTLTGQPDPVPVPVLPR